MAVFNSYVKLPEGNTIFSGMNIHQSQLFWCEQKGYYWFWPVAIWKKHISPLLFGTRTGWWFHVHIFHIFQAHPNLQWSYAGMFGDWNHYPLINIAVVAIAHLVRWFSPWKMRRPSMIFHDVATGAPWRLPPRCSRQNGHSGSSHADTCSNIRPGWTTT